MHILNENIWISIMISLSLKFVHKDAINDIPALGADQPTSHYLKQWWLDDWRIYASLGFNGLTWVPTQGLVSRLSLIFRTKNNILNNPHHLFCKSSPIIFNMHYLSCNSYNGKLGWISLRYKRSNADYFIYTTRIWWSLSGRRFVAKPMLR